jgi:hypothetical protein
MRHSLKRILPAFVAGIVGVTVVVVLNLSGARVQAQTTADTVPEWQKAAGGKMTFDVASVKPNKAGLPPFGIMPRSNVPLDSGDGYPLYGGFISATNWPLSKYIEFAYKITDYQYRILLWQLPKWAISPVWFDIEARAEGNPTKDRMPCGQKSQSALKRLHFQSHNFLARLFF